MTEGYKITELGEIPVDWEVKKISGILKTVAGYAFKSAKFITEYHEECYQVIRMGNVQMGKIAVERNPVYIPKKEIDEKERRYILQNEDILISLTGTVNKTDYGNIAYVSYNNKYLVNQRVVCLRPIEIEDIAKFYYYYFQTQIFREQFFECGVGGTGNQANVSVNDLNSLNAIQPSKIEQQKIADILSTVDCQIEQTESLIDKTKELKEGLMLRLLTKGIGHDRFKDTEIGRIPEEWQIKSLNEIAYRIGDGLHGTPIYSEDGGYYFINGNNLTNGKIQLKNETKEISESEFSKYKKELTNSTILISLNGTIGNLAYYNFEKVVLGKSAGYITLKNIVNKDYIFFSLNSNRVQSHFYKELTGTTIKNLSLDTLRKTNIAIPNIEEQKQISLILSSIDDRIEEYEIKKEKLQELKRGLMQKLLTGKLRVTV